MNRAWIPAGALASVSVAGLIALGPLTDSLGTTVQFANSVPMPTTATKRVEASVPVSVSLKGVGHVDTKPLVARGGAATNATAADTGFVAEKRSAASRSSTTSSAPAVGTVAPAPPPAPPVEPKKVPKRQESIGTTGETNGDQGFAGGSSGSGAVGEQSSTPGSATP
jgi:hypothetical protein